MRLSTQLTAISVLQSSNIELYSLESACMTKVQSSVSRSIACQGLSCPCAHFPGILEISQTQQTSCKFGHRSQAFEISLGLKIIFMWKSCFHAWRESPTDEHCRPESGTETKIQLFPGRCKMPALHFRSAGCPAILSLAS